jgi:hypothetical protein
VVPAGFVAVVRCMDAYYGLALSDRKVYAEGHVGQVFWQESVGPNLAGWRQWTGREVFYAGETFRMFGDDVVDMTASGYLLELP